MKAWLCDAESREVMAEVQCTIRKYQDPDGELSGQEGVFELVLEQRKLTPGTALLKLEDGRSALVTVEKLRRESGKCKGILWLLEKPAK